jgi:ribulose-5-phosphate 4-epimerase/fuculose-1-phosphate aldolase
MQPFRRRDFMAAGAAFLTSRTLFAQNPPVADRRILIQDLVLANHILAAQGIVDGFGHVSVRLEAERYLLSRSLAPASVAAADIIEYNLDSNPVAPETRGSYKERFIHGEIYRARPDVMSIVHCHAASLIPFGITKIPLQPVYHMSSFVGEGVPVFEIREESANTDMLVSTPALGRALAKTLGNKPAALMRGHGAVIVGPSIIEAVSRAVYLEVNARVQAQAMALGKDITYLSPAEVKNRDGNSDADRSWNLWKQQAAQNAK